MRDCTTQPSGGFTDETRVILKRDIRQEAVRDIHAPAGRVFDDKMVETFGRDDFNLPHPRTLVRQLNRAREKLRPQEPTSLDFEFDADYLGEKFLVGDVRVGDERHMMLATADQICLLQRARTWYLDGTFRVVLRKIVELMDVAPVVEAFTMDFEAGLWQALREVFPRSKLHGCGFHWASSAESRQSACRQPMSDGKVCISMELLALPFLPPGDIPRAFQKLKDRSDGSSEQLRELFHYVTDQWLENSIWSPDEWSVYRKKRWHRRMNARAGRGQLQFYVLLGLLLKEAKLVPLQAQLVGEGIGRNRREVYSDMDMRIDELWEKYDAHDILCENFLREIGEING
ncbi:LOW QUALITY PROTEIN: hypothetical protein MAR_021513 [Mya arenaria]|uniref:MULE transposase domain-containing protein n=1 Tax=Mya arenaria TaxID=6604 RepID=A0ABY7EAL2_MYAAR|nr:LOW QUALITY PROTEIN: hypothetical protein MAR_021513 [Mya arenaria]